MCGPDNVKNSYARKSRTKPTIHIKLGVHKSPNCQKKDYPHGQFIIRPRPLCVLHPTISKVHVPCRIQDIKTTARCLSGHTQYHAQIGRPLTPSPDSQPIPPFRSLQNSGGRIQPPTLNRDEYQNIRRKRCLRLNKSVFRVGA
jgi:hypothetical protein